MKINQLNKNKEPDQVRLAQKPIKITNFTLKLQFTMLRFHYQQVFCRKPQVFIIFTTIIFFSTNSFSDRITTGTVNSKPTLQMFIVYYPRLRNEITYTWKDDPRLELLLFFFPFFFACNFSQLLKLLPSFAVVPKLTLSAVRSRKT